MNTRLSVLLIFAALTVLYSCKNNDEVLKKVVTTGVNIVNASPDTLNFYLNGTRQNNASSIYPNGQSYYIQELAGMQNYSFKKAGPANYNVLFNLPENLPDSTYHSIYVFGEAADKTFVTLDDLQPDTSTSTPTQIKFVNVSPDAGPLNVTVGDTVSFPAVAFKTSSAFQLTGGGLKEVKVFQIGSSTPLKDTSIVFQIGYTYSLFSKGLLKGTGNAAFNVGVAINVN